uniref:Uncharacterized protein n=1 Tax=Acrobeloides nanus TaxID=290746 RepID=A0A914C516_9BILA
FKLYVNPCERHSTLFEAGPFGLIEDPDLVMGPIKGVKPTGNRVNKICGFWVICAEDLSAAKLTYLKIIDSIDQKTSLQGYLKRNFPRVEGFRMGYANINDVNGMREQGSDHRHIERNAEMLENVHINDGRNYPAQGDYYESYNQEGAYQLKTNNNRVQLQAYQQPVFSTFALEDDEHDQQPTMPFSTGQQFQQGYRSLKTGQIYLPSTFSQSSTPNLP